jgi:hypothetical protein
MQKDKLKTQISQRSDGMWIVDAKLSAVRIGLQDKEFVNTCITYPVRKENIL